MDNLGLKVRILLILTSIGLVISITSFSYAYFVGQINDGTVNNNSVTTGVMEVAFIDGELVGTTSNMIPGQSVTKHFSVVNTGTVATRYDIYLNDVVNTFVDKSDLVYSLSSTGGVNISQTIAPSTNTKIASNVILDVGATHTYSLTLDFLETGDNQDDNRGVSFSATVGLIEKEVILNPYVYATFINGEYGVITQKIQGTLEKPKTVILPYNNAEYLNYNYLRYTLVNDEIDTSIPPEVCVYYDELGELCLKNNNYISSLNSLLNYLNFDENTWNHSESGDWSTVNDTFSARCHENNLGDYTCNFSPNNVLESFVTLGLDGTVDIVSGYFVQECKVRSDNMYSCYLST